MPNLSIRTTTNLSKLLIFNRVVSIAKSDALKQVIIDVVKTNIEQNFETESDPEGVSWPALAPSTRRYGRGTKILQATGAGKRSIKVAIQGDTITIRFVGYMKFHQRGTRKMPKRQFAPTRGNFKIGKIGTEVRAKVKEFLAKNLHA